MRRPSYTFVMKNVLNRVITALAVFQVSLAVQAQTAVPNFINYQGALVDAAGNKLPDGNTNVVFRVWDSGPGGNVIWGPKTNSVALVGGVFNTLIGGNDFAVPAPRAFADVIAAQAGKSTSPAFLELTVGSIQIQPRQQILTAPYAFVANTANTANRAGFATNANAAVTAATANFATTAGSATTADSATTATTATTAGSATTATTATYSEVAGTANFANQAGLATEAVSAAKLNGNSVVYGTVSVIGSGASTSFIVNRGSENFSVAWDNVAKVVRITWAQPWASYPTVMVMPNSLTTALITPFVDDWDLASCGIIFRSYTSISAYTPVGCSFNFIAIGKR